MQTFTAQLSETIDPTAFDESWQIDAKLNYSPKVDFDFGNEGRVVMTLHTRPTSPWQEDNFKKAFTFALHRVASDCDITWL